MTSSTKLATTWAASLAVTGLDVHVQEFPRVAGRDRGRLHNGWLDCPYEVHTHSGRDENTNVVRFSARGWAWKATFKATDDGTVRLFTGTGKTRAHATQLAIDALTKHIKRVVDERRTLIVLDTNPTGHSDGHLTAQETVIERYTAKGRWARLKAWWRRLWF